MEQELVTARAELARATAHITDLEAELFAVAARLTAKEAEHEAVLTEVQQLRRARTELEQQVQAQQVQLEQKSKSFVERAARSVVRKVRS